MGYSFIKLCEDEIGKGNRPNSHFNVNGWKNLVKRFNEVTGRSYKEWILFRKLMHREIGVGWNPIKNSLDASNEWWKRKIKVNWVYLFLQENSYYSKLRNKDLSLIWFRYDTLFFDVAATTERARAPSQRSGNEIDSYEEILEDNGESNNQEEEQVHIGDSDDTENIEISDYNVNSGTKKTNNVRKKKISGATSLKEDTHSLLYFMGNGNTVTSLPSTDQITIGAAIELLNNVLGIAPQSGLWNYLSNLSSKKEM
ncbi:hypothetical protein CDL12_05325 [Handroanthus impetiginosus]|uniref:Myb/SANT-like domain-containing protein n=1 Tax=Handroanthus impetiginosus TaxID=429701 RepID=A0A2G9HWT1_9LAMI|nr:hypothetical protein CDL12_05325 [Handroanthus impetiginosus]